MPFECHKRIVIDCIYNSNSRRCQTDLKRSPVRFFGRGEIIEPTSAEVGKQTSGFLQLAEGRRAARNASEAPLINAFCCIRTFFGRYFHIPLAGPVPAP